MSDLPALPLLHVELVTLFPELFDSILGASLLGKAIENGLVAVDRTSPRDFGIGKHRSVDDAPYGGGPGMVMRPEPIAAAIDDIESKRGRTFRVFLSPSGALFNQARAIELLARRRVLFVCGRYEGFDERVCSLYADQTISIGDFVLAGGELAAAAMLEAMARLVPGFLGCSESTVDESFSAHRLEYPQFTRPPEFRGLAVPEVLLSGDHKAVDRWRRHESLQRTMARRPTLIEETPLDPEERRLLDDFKG